MVVAALRQRRITKLVCEIEIRPALSGRFFFPTPRESICDNWRQSRSFAGNDFRWDARLHYLGGLAPGEPERMMLDWLTDGRIEFAPMGPVYDTLHFRDDFSIQLSRPEAAQRQDLKELFRPAPAISTRGSTRCARAPKP
jgi:hypothetical protein